MAQYVLDVVRELMVHKKIVPCLQEGHNRIE